MYSPSWSPFPVHQARALVSCLPPGLVIYLTIDNIHAGLSKHPTLTLWLSYFPGSTSDTFNLGDTSFRVISFCLFILFIGLLCQEYWSGLLFLPPVDHLLSELFIVTHPSWVTLHGMAHSFIGLHKPLTTTRLWSMKGLWHRVWCMEVLDKLVWNGGRGVFWSHRAWLASMDSSNDTGALSPV